MLLLSWVYVALVEGSNYVCRKRGIQHFGSHHDVLLFLCDRYYCTISAVGACRATSRKESDFLLFLRLSFDPGFLARVVGGKLDGVRSCEKPRAPTRHFSDMDCTWACSLESTAHARQCAATHGKAPCKNERRSYAAVQKWTAELRRRAKMDTPSQPLKDGEVTIILLYLGGPFSTAGVLNGKRPKS